MINDRLRPLISIGLKVALVICATVGLTLCFNAIGGFMSGDSLILYFTIQSNIWIALGDLYLGIKQFMAYKGGKYSLSRADEVLHLVLTVAITLTGIVYCCVLMPVFLSYPGGGGIALAPSQILVHMIVPALALIDYIGLTRNVRYKKTDFLFSAIPPIYYLGFSICGYFLGWDFGGGANYPYFFLNYGSPVGLFGFGGEMPYFMGSFYWIIAICVFVLALSKLLTVIVTRLTRFLPGKI